MTIKLPENNAGELFLVSGGIGDADNLTLKVLNIIKRADLLLAMPFVQQQLAEYLPEGIPVLDPGHGLFNPMVPKHFETQKIEHQEETIRQRIRQAIFAGQCVVVIEFGDPVLFGPLVGYLTEFRDLNPIVLPGVSSFNAANALLAQPLLNGTHQRLLMTTINGLENYQGSLPDILVLFTMQLEVPALSRKLLQLYPPDTSVALVFHAGFTHRQRSLYLRLEQLAETAKTQDIPWECLIYVGDIDAL